MKKLHILIPSMLCAVSITVGLTAPSLARVDDGAGVHQTDMQKLKDKGYNCQRVGVNFTECTKSGKPAQWCTDNGKCTEAPLRQTPVEAPTHEEGAIRQTPVDPVRNAPIRYNIENRRLQNR